MFSRFASLLLVSISLVACAPPSTTFTPSSALLIAQQAQQGCLGATLELFSEVADRLAPLATARDIPSLEANALSVGCLFTPGEPAYLYCDGLPLRGDRLTLLLTIRYVKGGFPVADPSLADGLSIEVSGVGGLLSCEGSLLLVRDPDAGIVVSGSLTTLLADGCSVVATAERVVGRRVADLPEGGEGFLFTEGNIDITVEGFKGADIAATAALVGRHALVAMTVNGSVFTADITLNG